MRKKILLRHGSTHGDPPLTGGGVVQLKTFLSLICML